MLAAQIVTLIALSSVPPAWQPVEMDADGVLRWEDDGGEVTLFGVNYYPMFWHNYKDLRELGVDFEEVIDRDLTHFVRMGLDTMRLHTFDRAISDADGNLLDNEQLRLLDYLIARAKERGIHTVLTPIAWWGTPNPNEGFSNRFTMPEMTSDPEAWAVQCTYLTQFMNHVNRYTGLAYKDDPCIPVIELINEPHYLPDTTDAAITTYINTLAKAVRDTGCTKPLFYNGWGNRHAAVRDADIQGSTFGWYPSGLGAGRSLRQDFLPRVNDYPQMRCPELTGKAKIVYEFDAADVPGSYIYPAMARAFRSGGAQIATQFQYDPLPLAPFNMGWHTHYLNLVCAPSMTVSFIIANEAFHRLPRLETYGDYPASNRFGPFRVSYEDDLSEFATDTAFMYSNDTATVPPAPEKLTRIVGCGTSPVVEYPGTGAYFLDKLAGGLWRLEVYPDAVWVADPYGNARFEREVSRLIWREWPMTLYLPDLGGVFYVEPLDAGSAHGATASAGRFPIRPGVYLLRSGAAPEDYRLPETIGRLGLREFVVPHRPEVAPLTAVRHEPMSRWVEGKTISVGATVASQESPTNVTLHLQAEGEDGFAPLEMAAGKPYQYACAIPRGRLRAGTASYYITVTTQDGNEISMPEKPWRLPVLARNAPVVVFDAAAQDHVNVWGHDYDRRLVAGMMEGAKALRISRNGFGAPPDSISFRVMAPAELTLQEDQLPACRVLLVRARGGEAATSAAEIVLIERDGSPWGTTIPLTTEWRDIEVPLSTLRHFAHWNDGLPARGGEGDHFNPERVAGVNVCFGAWLYPEAADKPHALEIERIALTK